jgi:hypothetical protein
MRYPTFIACLIITLMATLASVSNADILTMKDGSIIEGKILSESRTKVVIETKISNIKTTKTLSTRQIEDITYKVLPDDFWESDRPSKKDKAKPSTKPKTDPLEPDLQIPQGEDKAVTPKKNEPSTGDRVYFAIVPINGGIGTEVNAYGLRKALTNISRQRIEHAVFVIDSPGGYIYSATEMMEIMKEFDDKITYHAVIEEGAISAASIFAACADNIFVRPGSRLGGAVAYSNDQTTGNAQVDAKMNSIWAAEVASRAESKGHMGELFRAMAVLEVQLWQAADGTISTSSSAGAEQIDTASTILTIRASQLVRAGMAKEISGDLSGIGELIGIQNFVERKKVGTNAMSSAADTVAKLEKRYKKAQEVFDSGMNDLAENDPYNHNDYTIYRNFGPQSGQRGTDFKYAFNAESLNLWRSRTDKSIRACNEILAALKELASVGKLAQRNRIDHLVPPSVAGDRSFKETDGILARLKRQRQNPPVSSFVD